MPQDDIQATPSTMRDRARLGQSPRRSRPPVTPSSINVQSWAVEESSSSEEASTSKTKRTLLNPPRTKDLHLEAGPEEDPFRDYLDYESDRDYLSENGSVPVDDDDPIETIEFGSDHHVLREDLRRKPSVRTVHQEPPDIDTENYPNSPSPFSPTPPTAFPEPLVTGYTDAPSVYSRPSWRASNYPAAGMSKHPFELKPCNAQRGQLADSVSIDNKWYTRQNEQQSMPPQHMARTIESTDNAHCLRDSEAGNDPTSNYGPFHGGPQEPDEAQVVALPDKEQTGQAWATPVPVSTAQAALGMPSAQNGSFGASPTSFRPSQCSPYSSLRRFWITIGPFITAATSLVAAVLTLLATRAYGSKIGSIWSVPNRVFSLTAAGDNPGDVRLGLEGWCLQDRWVDLHPGPECSCH